MASGDVQWQEQTRLFNFLKHYQLQQYHQRFLDNGVTRLSHLKDAVDDDSLDHIGLSIPEKHRLRKKVKENVESFGKFKNWLLGKSTKFDEPVTELTTPPLPEQVPARTHTAAIIPKDQIKLGDKIGEGAHGSVHKGIWADINGSVAVAVKRLYGQQEVQDQFIKEANSMCSLNHPNIIRLYGIVLSEPLMLIEELAPLGNLHSFLHKNGKRITLKTFHSYASQVADAMRYLENHRVVHRDLATRNVLLVQEETLKLSDFGMARVLDEQNVYNLSNLGARIPVAWTSIEALTQAKFSTASDVWSFGVLLWELYSLGETPFQGKSPVQIRDMLLQGDRLSRPKRCPVDMYAIIKSCWNHQPQDRPTFQLLHSRIGATTPTVVRAIKAHEVAEDISYLSFKTGELLYVIDKPKPEWIFGMSAEGVIGQLPSDTVTNVVAALDTIKAKVISGKVKAADLSISDPTSVDHIHHWGRDGSNWPANEHDLAVMAQHSPVDSSPKTKHNGHSSPSGVATSYRRLSNMQSPPLGLSKSPLARSPPHPSTAHDDNHPPLQPTTSHHPHTAAPEPTYQITYGDEHFMGTQRYVPNRESFSGNKDEPLSESAVKANVGHNMPGIERLKLSPSPPASSGEEGNYIKMLPHSVRQDMLSHVGNNEQPAVGVPHPKTNSPISSQASIDNSFSPRSVMFIKPRSQTTANILPPAPAGHLQLQPVPARRQSEGRQPVPKPRHSIPQEQTSERQETTENEPTSRVGIFGNPAFEAVRIDQEFSNTQSAIIRSALQKHNNDPEKAKEEIRVMKLMAMDLPNINETDCRRALSHCQQKTDRAAEWLLQISFDIEERAQ